MRSSAPVVVTGLGADSRDRGEGKRGPQSDGADRDQCLAYCPLAAADRAQPGTVGRAALEVGAHYEVVVTNRGGLYRYRLGDVVRVEGHHARTPVLAFAWRRGTVIDLAGEHTTEAHLTGRGDALVDFAVDGDVEASPPRYAFFVELAAEVEAGALARARDASLARPARDLVTPCRQLLRVRGVAPGPCGRRLGSAAQASAAERRRGGAGVARRPRAGNGMNPAPVRTAGTPRRISSTTMQRRSFVQASILGATTSGLTTACGPTQQGMNAPTAADDPFDARLAQLDREMEDIRCRSIDLGRVARKAANDVGVCREDPLDAQLYRSSLRALVLTAHIKDLSEADRGRPEVQARLDAHAAEVDFAVHGMAHRLAHMSPEEMTRVQDRLRRDPEMAERIVEYIDDEARKSDFPLGRRLRLRRLAKTTLWRLRRQPAEMVIRETTDKLRRLTDRLGPIAVREPFARPRAEELAYWEAQTLRVVERYEVPAPPVAAAAAPEAAAATALATGDAAATGDPAAGRRAAADARRARAEALANTDPTAAAEAFRAAGSLYEAAASQLVESDEHRATRADLVDQAVQAYLRAYGLSTEPAPLRLAASMLRTHYEAFRAAYGERRLTLLEYTQLQAHIIHIQGMLLRLPTPTPTPTPEPAEDFRAETRRRVLRGGGITLGVGLGLLALGLGLGFTVGFFGFILATLAGVALLAGMIVMIVGAAISAS